MQRRQESEVTSTGSETAYEPERKFSLDVFTFMEMPALPAPLHAYRTHELLIIGIGIALPSIRIVSRWNLSIDFSLLAGTYDRAKEIDDRDDCRVTIVELVSRERVHIVRREKVIFNLLRWSDVSRTSGTFCFKIAIFSRFSSIFKYNPGKTNDKFITCR